MWLVFTHRPRSFHYTVCFLFEQPFLSEGSSDHRSHTEICKIEVLFLVEVDKGGKYLEASDAGKCEAERKKEKDIVSVITLHLAPYSVSSSLT